MHLGGNIIYNKGLERLSQQAGADVTSAIQKASANTGVNFAYLMEQAAAESSFKTNAQAKTSSARGLYQFIERTWLQMVKDHGEQYGLGHYADKISDKFTVTDKAMRKEILALRDDPQIASYMAAEFAANNKAYLERNLNKNHGDVGSTELYFAHFLGAGQATAFLNAMKQNPMQAAADLFPRAANANQNVFYNSKTGQPRSLGEVYAFFDKKFSTDTPMNAEDGLRSNRLSPNAIAPDAPSRKPPQFRTLDADGTGLRIAARGAINNTAMNNIMANPMTTRDAITAQTQMNEQFANEHAARERMNLIGLRIPRAEVTTPGSLIATPLSVITLAQTELPGMGTKVAQRTFNRDDVNNAPYRMVRQRPSLNLNG